MKNIAFVLLGCLIGSIGGLVGTLVIHVSREPELIIKVKKAEKDSIYLPRTFPRNWCL